MIEITNFKANYGDTFLIEVALPDVDPVYLLVDCGFGFATGALPVISDLGKQGKKISRFIITHFDADHIAWAYAFLENNGTAAKPRIIGIEQIWLNTFRHLQFDKNERVIATPNDPILLGAAMAAFKPFAPGEEKEIGAKQALLLGRLILSSGYDWNTDFNQQAASVHQEVLIGNDIRLTLLTPTMEKLQALEVEFIAKLKEFKLSVNKDLFFDDAFELFLLQKSAKEKSKEGLISASTEEISATAIDNIGESAHYDPDDAIGNGSSISFLLEVTDKRMLFLADAHAEDIISALTEKMDDKGSAMLFDVVKVAHHGSFRNNNPALFAMIDSDKWIFSTNGKHPKHTHPDFATIAHIVKRPLPQQYAMRTLYFNYELAHLLALNDPELKDRFKYDVKVQPTISL